MIGNAALFVVGAMLVIGGLVLTVLSGVPDLCNTSDGYCLDSLGWLQPIFSGLGVAVTTIGFGMIFRFAKRRTKTSA